MANIELYSSNEDYKLYQGSMLDLLEVIEKSSIDSIVTDPPYELNFMNKGWDNSGIAFQADTWRKCYEALKPGGYLLAFGGSRTFHRIACAIEDAGFEIRDTVMWLYGSGFPKSMSIGKCIESKLINGSANVRDIKKLAGEKVKVGGGWVSNELEQGKRDFDYEQTKTVVDYQTEQGKRWSGWGTALKPSYEPIIVARKPCEGSCINNVLKYGVGGINIDECRVEHNEQLKYTNRKPKSGSVFNTDTSGYDNTENHIASANEKGRFPANTILTYDETDFDEVCGGFPNSGSGNGGKPYNYAGRVYDNKDTSMFNGDKPQAISNYNDFGSASRYFYCAKASKRDRDEGLDGFGAKTTGELQGGRKEGSAGSMMLCDDGTKRLNPYAGTGAPKRNIHPTVKPTNLMQYLIRLVTPNGGTVLDPFNGSGSTGKAVMWENRDRNKGYKYIGIELTAEYLPIAKARIEYVKNAQIEQTGKPPVKQAEGQMSLFNFFDKEAGKTL